MSPARRGGEGQASGPWRASHPAAAALCWPAASGGSGSPAGTVRRRGGVAVEHTLPSPQPSGAWGPSTLPSRTTGLLCAPQGPPGRDAAAAAWGDGRAPPDTRGGTLRAGVGCPGGCGRGHSHRGGNGVELHQKRLGTGRFSPLLPPPWAAPGFGGILAFPHSVSPGLSAMPASDAVPQPSPSKRQKGSGPGEACARLRFTKLSENAFAPSRGSARAAGYDLYR